MHQRLAGLLHDDVAVLANQADRIEILIPQNEDVDTTLVKDHRDERDFGVSYRRR